MQIVRVLGRWKNLVINFFVRATRSRGLYSLPITAILILSISPQFLFSNTQFSNPRYKIKPDVTIIGPICMADGIGRQTIVIGDGAYDDRDERDLIRKKRGKCLIPPPSNAVCHGTDVERDKAVLTIQAFGGDKIAKSIWGKLSGYSRRALVETTFSRYKKKFGERAFSRTQEKMIVENRLNCVLLNKMIRPAA